MLTYRIVRFLVPMLFASLLCDSIFLPLLYFVGNSDTKVPRSCPPPFPRNSKVVMLQTYSRGWGGDKILHWEQTEWSLPPLHTRRHVEGRFTSEQVQEGSCSIFWKEEEREHLVAMRLVHKHPGKGREQGVNGRGRDEWADERGKA